VRTARSAVNLYNRSGIYRSSHVVIRPIICITFTYTCLHIATGRFYPFSYTKDQYLGPVRMVMPVQCFVTPFDKDICFRIFFCILRGVNFAVLHFTFYTFPFYQVKETCTRINLRKKSRQMCTFVQVILYKFSVDVSWSCVRGITSFANGHARQQEIPAT